MSKNEKDLDENEFVEWLEEIEGKCLESINSQIKSCSWSGSQFGLVTQSYSGNKKWIWCESWSISCNYLRSESWSRSWSESWSRSLSWSRSYIIFKKKEK